MSDATTGTGEGITVAQALERAAGHLSRGERAEALALALGAWQKVRHPRIADVVDRISAELLASGDPIRAKTLEARNQLAKQMAERRDPVDLGRLLALPWPGRWQGALPWLQIVAGWPDDPRLAMALAHVLDDTPYDTWTSYRFYRPLLERLAALRDIRTLPILRGQSAKQKSHYYRHSVAAHEVRVAEHLEKAFAEGSPKLAAEEEQAIAAFEAMFAGEVAAERSKSKGEADFLAAIHAHPDDLGHKSVYADWLTERGDPRGELISLMIARREGRATEASERRQRALLKEHGKAWTGSLDAWFEEEPRVFEDGFFAAGVLRAMRKSDLDAAMADPAWSLVRGIELGRQGEIGADEIVERAGLKSLRALHRVPEEVAARMATGPERGLSELSFEHSWTSRDDELRLVDGSHPMAQAKSLPKLSSLRVLSSRLGFGWLAGAPVLSRIERLTVPADMDGAELRKLLAALEHRAGALREIALLVHDWRTPVLEPFGWRVRLTRDAAPGPFTRLSAEWIAGRRARRWNLVSGLAGALACVPPTWLREIVVAPSRALDLKAEDRARVREVIAVHENVERVDLPWEEVRTSAKATSETTSRATPERVALRLRLHGEGLLHPEHTSRVWDLVASSPFVGARFDSFTVGYGGAHRKLGKDPRARLLGWVNNPRVDRIELYEDGASSRLWIERSKRSSSEPNELTMFELSFDPDTTNDFIAWLLSFLDIARFHYGTCHFEPDEHANLDALSPLSPVPSCAWIMIFGDHLRRYLPAADVERLGGKPGLEGLFVRETRHNLVVGLGPRPAPAASRAEALGAALGEIADRRLVEALGYDFSERCGAILAPVATDLGLSTHPQPGSQGRLERRFVGRRGNVELRLVVELRDLLGTPRVTAGLQHQTDGDAGYYPWPLVENALLASTRDEVTRGLEEIAAAARTKAEAFFADPAPKRRRR